jgi:hypothetical protein
MTNSKFSKLIVRIFEPYHHHGKRFIAPILYLLHSRQWSSIQQNNNRYII